MTDEPDYERIWLMPRIPGGEPRTWCWHDVWSDDPEFADDPPPTEYVRADLIVKWRVDIAGYSVSVLGAVACAHLEKVNFTLARMKLALHRITHARPEEAAAIARDALEPTP